MVTISKNRNLNILGEIMKLMLMGPPGSGKGTQAKIIAKKYQIPHVSTGDIIRENIKNNTSLGKKFKSYSEKGELVPDDLVIDIMQDRLSQSDCSDGFLLDGFPRTIYQAGELDKIVPLNKVINIKVSDEQVTIRLLKRAETEGRADDTSEVIENRLKVYRDQTEPLIEFYKGKGILEDIDGELSVEEVFALAQKVLSKD